MLVLLRLPVPVRRGFGVDNPGGRPPGGGGMERGANSQKRGGNGAGPGG